MKGKILSLFFILAILSLAVLPNNVLASKNTYTSATENNIQYSSLVHSAYNYEVNCFYENPYIKARIIASNGTLLATISKTITSTNAFNGYASIAEFDSSNVIVFYIERYTYWFKLITMKINLGTYGVTTYNSSWEDSGFGSSTLSMRIGKIKQVGSSFYALALAYSSTNDDHLAILKFNGATSSIYEKGTVTITTLTDIIDGFVDSTYIYFLTSYNGNIPRYFIYDTSGNTLTLLATGSTAFLTVDNTIYINGSIVYIDSKVYLYHAWTRGRLVDSVRNIDFIQQVLVFNDSISVGNYESQYYQWLSHTTSYPVSSTNLWSIPIEFNYTNYRIYYTDLVSGTVKIFAIDYKIYNFSNYGTILAIQDVVVTNPIEYTNVDEYYYWLRFPNTTFSSFAVATYSTSKYVYYGLTPLSSPVYVYDVTLSISPNDAILFTNKTYLLTFTTYKYGEILGSQPIKVIFDATQYRLGITTPDGHYYVNMMFVSSGNRTITAWVYEGTTVVYIESFTYLVAESFIPSVIPVDYLLPQTIIAITQWVPALLLVLVPAFLMSSVLMKAELGVEGFIGGLAMGVGFGVAVGMIPFFMLIIAGLVLCLFLFAKVSR